MNIFEAAIATSSAEKSFNLATRSNLISLETFSCSKCSFLMKLETGNSRHGIEIRWKCGKKVCEHSSNIF